MNNLMKQAQRMQRQMEENQKEMEGRRCGGGSPANEPESRGMPQLYRLRGIQIRPHTACRQDHGRERERVHIHRLSQRAIIRKGICPFFFLIYKLNCFCLSFCVNIFSIFLQFRYEVMCKIVSIV